MRSLTWGCDTCRDWEQTRRRSSRSSAPGATRKWRRSRRFTKRVRCCSSAGCSNRSETMTSSGCCYLFFRLFGLNCPIWAQTLAFSYVYSCYGCFSWSSRLLFLPAVFKKELEKDVAGDTSGDFAKLLLALVQVDPGPGHILGFYSIDASVQWIVHFRENESDA